MGCRRAAPTIVADDAAVDVRPERPVKVVEVDRDDVLVAVRADGSIFVEQTAVSLPLLEKSAAAWTAKNPEIRVRIAADSALLHARLVEIIDAMKRSGVKKFALMVAPKSS
ncbi:MAG: ExbD/TolR family protein [Polyangiales bacterium]